MTIKPAGKGKYVLVSHTGKRLTKPTTKKNALKRERQIQFFKNNKQYKKDHHGRGIPLRRKGKK